MRRNSRRILPPRCAMASAMAPMSPASSPDGSRPTSPRPRSNPTRSSSLEHVIDEQNQQKRRNPVSSARARSWRQSPRAANSLALKVLGDDGGGDSRDVLRALEYVRTELNGNGKELQVQGVTRKPGLRLQSAMVRMRSQPTL